MRRVLGWFVIVVMGSVALLFTGMDLRDYSTGGAWPNTLLGARWFELHPDSLQLIQPAIERYLHPSLWSGIQWVLTMPAWAVPAAVAAFFILIKLLTALLRGR